MKVNEFLLNEKVDKKIFNKELMSKDCFPQCCVYTYGNPKKKFPKKHKGEGLLITEIVEHTDLATTQDQGYSEVFTLEQLKQHHKRLHNNLFLKNTFGFNIDFPHKKMIKSFSYSK